MAYYESHEILEIDDDIHSLFSDNLDRMIFYYGPKDKYSIINTKL